MYVYRSGCTLSGYVCVFVSVACVWLWYPAALWLHPAVPCAITHPPPYPSAHSPLPAEAITCVRPIGLASPTVEWLADGSPRITQLGTGSTAQLHTAPESWLLWVSCNAIVLLAWAAHCAQHHTISCCGGLCSWHGTLDGSTQGNTTYVGHTRHGGSCQGHTHGIVAVVAKPCGVFLDGGLCPHACPGLPAPLANGWWWCGIGWFAGFFCMHLHVACCYVVAGCEAWWVGCGIIGTAHEAGRGQSHVGGAGR